MASAYAIATAATEEDVHMPPIEFTGFDGFNSDDLDAELYEIDDVPAGATLTAGVRDECASKSLFQCLNDDDNDSCEWRGGLERCRTKKDDDEELSMFQKAYALYHSLLAGTPEPIVGVHRELDATGLVAVETPVVVAGTDHAHGQRRGSTKRKPQRRRNTSSRRRGGGSKTKRRKGTRKKRKGKRRGN